MAPPNKSRRVVGSLAIPGGKRGGGERRRRGFVIAETRKGSPPSISLKRDRRHPRVRCKPRERSPPTTSRSISRAALPLLLARGSPQQVRPAPRIPPRRVSTASPSRDARLRGRASRDRSRPARRGSVGFAASPRGFAGCTAPRPDADLRPALPPPPTRNQPHTMPKKRRANGRNKPAGARGHVRTPHRPPNRATLPNARTPLAR